MEATAVDCPFVVKVRVRELKVVRETAPKYSGASAWASPSMAAKYIREIVAQEDEVEHFVVIPLSTSNKPLGYHVIGKGSLNAVIVTPREVFRAAILMNAASVILAHTHPSGNPEPSREDIAITRQLVEAGKTLDIRVVDHVIVPLHSEEYVSLAERHVM